jgi:V8-like Glu-specific endopeptidase
VPWLADVGGCGGTLVAPDRVLTAGHCVMNAPLSQIAGVLIRR